mmetsp:Transcript_24078/g.40383  ORF Transcript_24078/g.40383 Transcript_24078/m.40383 type:complete len:380 (+) Transcript_24078:215-1354(+)|eukprot:CAMPEP_0198210226 /NCGR_PEP_ID=MMETSP1445-20131203/19971_1 /TAXON_ID=36898 /ORGANISM="Pyramimonas sp., Strain CCMP2087" /LENGTH=379 /DNA_ID=CAMNT_0043884233 /DNA_START=205 /DNA_END=1344 /DNA_ORIENTATION=+
MSSYAVSEASTCTASKRYSKLTSRSRTAPRLFANCRQRQIPSRATFKRSATQAASGPLKAAVPLACPVSLKVLDTRGFCDASGLEYGLEDGVWDLTIGAAKNKRSEAAPATVTDLARGLLPKELRGLLPTGGTFGTTTFESPIISFVYERGWRQAFAGAGFPGPEEEFEMAQKALRSAFGGTLIDASCGSGLFTRRFAQSGDYGEVVALDYSEAMLQQALTFCKEESLPMDALTFVRADIGRIPFPEGTIDGVHAGAAIHCWPSPKSAVAEIARVLKPGATYCGTTFLNPRLPFVDEEFQQLASSMMRGSTTRTIGFQYWDKRTLQDLFESCGFENFECDIRQQFIFYSVRKPKAAVPQQVVPVVDYDDHILAPDVELK